MQYNVKGSRFVSLKTEVEMVKAYLEIQRIRFHDCFSVEYEIERQIEQVRIVKAIKSKEEKINALITNEEKQIEKLKAYKQALISEVVTKGLDSNVPMKDSGVEWIGKIPYDWRISKIKFTVFAVFF